MVIHLGMSKQSIYWQDENEDDDEDDNHNLNLNKDQRKIF